MKWCHSYPELEIWGLVPHPHEEFVSQLIPKDLTGKTILDLAAWDGYYSFLAAKRNAKVVIAVDNAQAERKDFNGNSETLSEKYQFLRQKIHSNVNFIPMNVFDIDKIKMNFDIIFCFGLYYHVKNPYDLFEKCYSKCKEMLLIEGEIKSENEPNMTILNPRELNDDPTNYWGPNQFIFI